VQALEHAEQLSGVRGVEADAVVAHDVGRAPVPLGALDRDPRLNFSAFESRS